MHWAVQWGGGPEDLRVTTSGVAAVDDLDAMMREAIADPQWRDGMKILIDHTQTDWAGFGAGDLQRRGGRLRGVAGPPGGPPGGGGGDRPAEHQGAQKRGGRPPARGGRRGGA